MSRRRPVSCRERDDNRMRHGSFSVHRPIGESPPSRAHMEAFKQGFAPRKPVSASPVFGALGEIMGGEYPGPCIGRRPGSARCDSSAPARRPTVNNSAR